MKFYLLLFIVSACIEPAEFDVPPAESLLIIDGMISDQPGPYRVTISRAVPLSVDALELPFETGAMVRLHDDLGNIEDFEEVSEGIYETRGAIQGQIGRSYHIAVTTADGEQYESTPEKIQAVGKVSEITYKYKKKRVEDLFGVRNEDYFNVYVNAEQGPDKVGYIRWKLTGTYKVTTHPELRETMYHPGAVPLKEPRPCSGYTTAVHPSGRGTIIVKVGECTCCDCYVDQFDNSPFVSDNILAVDGEFSNVKVGEVPINTATFMEKYMLRVEQMSLSRDAFDFFKLIKIQKEEASSIFQPNTGELVGNIKAVNPDNRVVGMFWATAITQKIAFIEKEDVPYPIPPFPVVKESCLLEFNYSTTEQPEEWED